jgi:GTP-binding protein Era
MKELNLQEILKNTDDLSEEKKVWYLAIIGRPNAWKSTFINSLLWEKVSITSNIPQTTRKRVLAIHNDDDSQIIFFDTPWIHKSEKSFNEAINEVAIKSLEESDLILYFIDSSRPGWEEEDYIKELINKIKVPILKIYTKTDLKSKINIPEKSLKISSTTKDGFENLIATIKQNLPVWPLLFPTDIYTKQDMFFRISEIIREKVFLNTKDELPHSIYIWVEEIEETKNKAREDMLKIVAYIYSDTDSQKYIVVWKNWSLITKIWKQARIELEKIFDKKVFLALRAKVRKNWRKNENLVKNILN